ncbi:MAG TPA: phage tail tip lysozyme, partial [Roseiarcus sp.]|nr:phage tail tip lysozyme [Roseiarcus sp.]
PAKEQLQKDLQQITLDELKERNRANEEAQRIEFERYRMDTEESDRIRAEEFQRQMLDFQDRQVARSSEMTLAEEQNPLAWVAPILAFLLVAMIWYLLHGIMTAREPVINKDVFNVVLGALVTAFTTVVAFYFGSSLSSSKKDAAIQSGRLTTNTNIATGNIAVDPDDDAGRDDPAPPPQQTPSGAARQTDDRSTPRWPTGPAPSGSYGLFRQKAPVVMRRLIQDVSVSEVQAAAMLGNIGWECAGFKALQEVKPVMGGPGGLGWCQWTAARRTSFVNWLRDNGWGENYHDDEANYGYLLYELHGPQRSSLNAVKGTSMVESATKTFMDIFERPNAKCQALDNRIGLAKMALQEYRRSFNV